MNEGRFRYKWVYKIDPNVYKTLTIWEKIKAHIGCAMLNIGESLTTRKMN